MITAAIVKQLRDKTNAGMMDCKKVLTETGGDIDAAVKLLRERGIAKAGAKADRAANQGIITAVVSEDGKSGILQEVNCETDFVSKNENFQSFVSELAATVFAARWPITTPRLPCRWVTARCPKPVKAKVVEIGENLIYRKYARFDAADGGVVVSYIHPPGKVGVLIEVGMGKPESAQSDDFQEMVKDLTLHIAACSPKGLGREDIPEDLVAAERDIFRVRLLEAGKPEAIIDKILEGQMGKFFGENCFLEQPFVKDGDLTVSQLLEAKGKELGDTFTVRRFTRFGLGRVKPGWESPSIKRPSPELEAGVFWCARQGAPTWGFSSPLWPGRGKH